MKKTLKLPATAQFLSVVGKDDSRRTHPWEPWQNMHPWLVSHTRLNRLFMHLWSKGANTREVEFRELQKKRPANIEDFVMLAITAHGGTNEQGRHYVCSGQTATYTSCLYGLEPMKSVLEADGAFLFLLDSCNSGALLTEFPARGTLFTSDAERKQCGGLFGVGFIDDFIASALLSSQVLERGLDTEWIRKYLEFKRVKFEKCEALSHTTGFAGRDLIIGCPQRGAQERYDFFFDNFLWSGTHSRERLPIFLSLPADIKERTMTLLKRLYSGELIRPERSVFDPAGILFERMMGAANRGCPRTDVVDLEPEAVRRLLDIAEVMPYSRWINDLDGYSLRSDCKKWSIR